MLDKFFLFLFNLIWVSSPLVSVQKNSTQIYSVTPALRPAVKTVVNATHPENKRPVTPSGRKLGFILAKNLPLDVFLVLLSYYYDLRQRFTPNSLMT